MNSPPTRIGLAIPRSWGSQWVQRALEGSGLACTLVVFRGVVPAQPSDQPIVLWVADERFAPPAGDGSPILSVVSPKADPPGGFAVRAGDIRGLTALLKAWGDPFPPAFHALPLPLFLLDQESRIVQVNAAGRRWMNLPAGDLLNCPLPLGSNVAEVLAAGRPRAGETVRLERIPFIGGDGGGRIAEVVLHGRPGGGVLAHMRDAAGEAEGRSRTGMTDRLGAIGRLAGGIAHDLNNILMVITSYTGLIRRKGRPAAPVAGFLDEIGKASDRAVRLTDQLLAFAQRQALQPRVVDLGTLARDRLPRLREILGPAVRIETDLPAGLPTVAVDVDKFAEVLDQLASNARDAMPSGGAVIIEASPADDPADWRADCPELGPGPFVAFLFSDTGHGMSPEVRDSVFEPFFTTKEKGKGTGMGMAMVYGFIRQSGGDIVCSSQPSLGTVIRILLPVSELVEADSAPESADPAAFSGKGRRVLVIEDEEAVLSSIVSILESLDFSVQSARTGEEAVKLAHGKKTQPDLIISDVILPGMDGKQAVEIILKAHPGIPVLYMSGYSGSLLAERGILPPGLVYLQKPFTVETLIARIATLLQ